MLAAGPECASLDEILARVTAALRSGDTKRATALAVRALADGVEHPLLLNLRAYCLENEGRDAEALSDLRRAAQLAPRDASILNALGLAYARCGYHGEAVRAFESAVAEQPGFSQAHFNRGWSLEEVGELASAQKSYLRAHETQPKAAEPLGRLASLAARRGAWKEAGAYAEQALAIDPNNPSAVLALGELDIELGAYGRAENRLRAFLMCPA